MITKTGQWRSIIWSDESRFELCIGDSRSRVLRRPAEAFHSDCLRRKTKFTASVMVWGCMSAQGVGNLCFINGTVNANKYQDILDQDLLPSVPRLQTSDGNFTFQQDGASCHTAKRITSWLREHHVPVLKWSANNPDLSPIETLWGKMKKALRTNPAKNLNDLREKIQSVWDNITPEECSSLVETLPSRINAVIKNKGDATQW